MFYQKLCGKHLIEVDINKNAKTTHSQRHGHYESISGRKFTVSTQEHGDWDVCISDDTRYACIEALADELGFAKKSLVRETFFDEVICFLEGRKNNSSLQFFRCKSR